MGADEGPLIVIRREVGRPGDPLLDLAEFGEGVPEVVVGSEAEVARWSLSCLVGEMLLAGDVVAPETDGEQAARAHDSTNLAQRGLELDVVEVKQRAHCPGRVERIVGEGKVDCAGGADPPALAATHGDRGER